MNIIPCRMPEFGPVKIHNPSRFERKGGRAVLRPSQAHPASVAQRLASHLLPAKRALLGNRPRLRGFQEARKSRPVRNVHLNFGGENHENRLRHSSESVVLQQAEEPAAKKAEDFHCDVHEAEV